jgi:hypothetical protein
VPLVVVVGVVDDWPALPPEPLLPLVPPPVCALKPSARKSAGATSHVDFIVVLLITGIVASRMMACQLPECRANNCQLTIPCCRAILSWLIFFLASVTAVSFSRFCWGLGAAAKWTAFNLRCSFRRRHVLGCGPQPDKRNFIFRGVDGDLAGKSGGYGKRE